jgi:hypothetical protein
MPPPLRIDRANRQLLYPCACGRMVPIPFDSLTADQWLDPCGCGEATIMFTPEQIAHYKGEPGPATQ